MMRTRSAWLPLLLILILVAGTGIGNSPVRAESPTPLDVQISEQTATPDYPAGITFDLAYTAQEPVVRAELFYAIADGETLNLVTPPLEPGETGQLSYLLDLQVYYLPPGVDLTWFWRLTGASGAQFETTSETVTWLDTRFDWQTIRSNNIIVSTYDGDASFAQAILDSAQTTASLIAENLGITLTQPITIWAYSSSADFAGTQAPNAEQWIAGIAYQSYRLVLAVLPTGNKTELGRVIPHEIAHQVVFQAISNPWNGLPTWLDEGFAELYQIGGKDQFPGLVRTAADQGVLFSVRSLNSGFPYDSGSATLAYAESYSIVSFIQERWGEDGLARLILAYRDGVSHDEAALSALGVDIDGLDELWKASLNYAGDQSPAGGTTIPVAPPRDTGTGWAQLLASGVLIWILAAIVGIIVMVRTWGRRRMDQEQDDQSDYPGYRIGSSSH